MKTIRAVLTAIALLPSSAALAHEGHHEAMNASVGLRHMLTQPDHLAILALAFGLAALSGWQVYRNRTPR